MKKSLSWAALAVFLSLSAYGPPAAAQAQRPGQMPPAAGPRLALIDVTKIFKNHARFKGMMEDMKKDVQQAENWVKNERLAIGKLVEELQTYDKGAREYQALEKDLAKRQADLEIQIRMQRKEFLQREAKIYYNVYQEIWQATDYFARQHKIDMVFRFNGDEVDSSNPDEILKHINKQVIWYDVGLDITPYILEELNRTAINPSAADRRGNAAPPTVPFNPTPR
ncbi:MAG: OmpH family outer membrane protein [Pirellulales bacterium]|nr:OmpH family outer membrane protein [Pirellulales bacterium]